MNRPNIVLLHSHDAGRFCEPYGYAVRTPNLQKFATEGVLFRNAYCAAPTCGPSRCALMSGQYPHQVGVYGLPKKDHWHFNSFDKHLVQNLNTWGYHTVLAGCQHEADFGDLSPLGYAEILGQQNEGKRLGECYPETINDVEAFLARIPEVKPFFLSFGIDEPHNDNLSRPELGLHGKADRHSKTRFYDPDRLDARYTAPLSHLPDIPEVRREMASLAKGVEIMDEYMGRVLDALQHRGLEDNTLVIVTTDHGLEIPGGKMTLGDPGVGVMLMIRGPGGFHGGQVMEGLVEQIDLFPTICDLLEVPIPSWLEGKSLLPLVRGDVEDGSLHDAVFFEQTYHGKDFEPLRAVRTERYKLVLRHFETGPLMTSPGRSSQALEKLGWYKRPLGKVELFDLYLDPCEACNRAEEPAYAVIRRDLEERLRAWMEKTDDHFRTGILPEPGSLIQKVEKH
mgnify:CR=1 FL=1